MTTVRLYIDADREPDFEAWFAALRAAFDALLVVQRDVLGKDHDRLSWVLVDMQSSPVLIDLRAVPAPGLPVSLVDTVATTFTRGVRHAAEHPDTSQPGLSRAAAEAVRAVALTTARGGLRGFATASIGDEDDATDAPGAAAPSWLLTATAGGSEEASGTDSEREAAPPIRLLYDGTLTGRIRILNVADQSDRFVWLNEEATRRRVKVRYQADLHDEIVQAIEEHGRGMHRVAVSGTVTTDTKGMPTSMVATDIEAIPLDEDLPPLASVAGSLSNLAGGLPAAAFIRAQRNQGNR